MRAAWQWTLVTTSLDTTARLWSISDAYHPTLLAAPLATYNEEIKSPAFSSDSHTLAVTGEDHDVNLWETDVERAVIEICQTVTSPIRPDQWNRYFPGRDYEPACPARADPGFRDATTKVPADSTSLVASNSHKCVAIKDDGALNGAPAHQIDCTDAPGEKWILRDVSAAAPGNTGDRIVKIVSAAADMCLESAEAERKIGGAALIVQRKCVDGNSAQLWILDEMERRADSVDVRFRGPRHRDCLNINGEPLTTVPTLFDGVVMSRCLIATRSSRYARMLSPGSQPSRHRLEHGAWRDVAWVQRTIATGQNPPSLNDALTNTAQRRPTIETSARRLGG